jgi:hypothetical protein
MIVDPFHSVQVGKKEVHFFMKTIGGPELLFRKGEETAPVVESGQFIDQGQLLQLPGLLSQLECGAFAFADVPGYMDHLGHPTVPIEHRCGGYLDKDLFSIVQGMTMFGHAGSFRCQGVLQGAGIRRRTTEFELVMGQFEAPFPHHLLLAQTHLGTKGGIPAEYPIIADIDDGNGIMDAVHHGPGKFIRPAEVSLHFSDHPNRIPVHQQGQGGTDQGRDNQKDQGGLQQIGITGDHLDTTNLMVVEHDRCPGPGVTEGILQGGSN